MWTYANKSLWTLIAALILILAGCSAPTATPVDVNIEGMLLFASDRSGREAYYLMPANGAQQEPVLLTFEGLAPNAQMDRPVWSPAMKKWLLSVMLGSDSDIYSADWDGKNLTNLTNNPGRYESGPVPSPDGKFIAYVAVQSDLDIFVIQPDGSNAKNLTGLLGGREINPIWTNDSNRLIFSSNHEGTPNIYQMTRDGKELTNFSKGSGLDEGYSLSPDQSAIVFASDRDGNMDIFRADLRSQVITNLTNSAVRDVEPIWSPDGNYILFRTVDQDNRDLMLINLADGTVTNLTNSPTLAEEGPTWWPDSQRIIYTARESDQLDVYTVDLSGNTQNITNSPANDYGGIWVQNP